MADNPGESPQSTTDLDIEEIKSFYDSVYYADGNLGEPQAVIRHYEGLARRIGLEAGMEVLDVACGAGGWLGVCQEAGATVAGVDLSERAIAACNSTMPSGEFYAQPAESLPFADERFDVITCLGSLEHFVDPESSLREMVRVARPGAVFVLLVPNKDFLTRKLGLFGGTYQVDAREVVRTLDEWDGLFRSAGLEVTDRWKDLHVMNLDWITRARVITWPLRAMQALALPVWPLKWQYQVYHQCVVRQV